MLSPITRIDELGQILAIASGPFSHYWLSADTQIRLTSYPLPDGSWNWADCPATDWTPALSSYPGPENI